MFCWGMVLWVMAHLLHVLHTEAHCIRRANLFILYSFYETNSALKINTGYYGFKLLSRVKSCRWLYYVVEKKIKGVWSTYLMGRILHLASEILEYSTFVTIVYFYQMTIFKRLSPSGGAAALLTWCHWCPIFYHYKRLTCKDGIILYSHIRSDARFCEITSAI